jgi:large subunit ribosomal protein L13
MKTFSAKAQDVERKWYVIDAADKILGQVAREAAVLLRGKHKPIFTPHVDTGDHVVIINAERVDLSGNKETQKIYTQYTGYVGNQKVETPRAIRRRKPELLVEKAVRGMVPHNKLGNAIFKKLSVYSGSEHPHEAQNPEVFEVK